MAMLEAMVAEQKQEVARSTLLSCRGTEIAAGDMECDGGGVSGEISAFMSCLRSRCERTPEAVAVVYEEQR